MSLDLILPFLEPLDKILEKPDITEFMINSDGSVFVEAAGGTMARIAAPVIDEAKLERAVKRMARSVGEEIGPDRPILNARLSDGSRAAAVFPPVSGARVSLTIRKFRPNWFTLHELIENGTLTGAQRDRMEDAVWNRKTILVSGGTGSGKTTITKALIDRIPAVERLGIIEDTEELVIRNPNYFRFTTKTATDESPAVTMRDLVRAALRHRPDRLIIGEMRGGEAFDFLDSCNTGHSGSISTVHANSPADALRRLGSLAMRAAVDVPYSAIQQDISDLINVVVQCGRGPDGKRRVTAIAEVCGLDPDTGKCRLEPAK